MKAGRYPPVSELTGEGRVDVVRDIFARAHARYDFLNRLLSFGRDLGWRAAAVRRMRFRGNRSLLDLATGTAELAMQAAFHHPEIAVTGVDFAPAMLEIGRAKVRGAGLAGRVRLLEADAFALPFPDASFGVTAVAFGLRNMPDARGALREMARVTVPGGQVIVLEMTYAPSPAFRPFYGFYLDRVLPGVARLFTRDGATYRYLGDSIRSFVSPRALAGLMEEAGLIRIAWRALTFGAAYLHCGTVPEGD